MKKMHVYDVYLDDGEHAIKVTIPASSKSFRRLTKKHPVSAINGRYRVLIFVNPTEGKVCGKARAGAGAKPPCPLRALAALSRSGYAVHVSYCHQHEQCKTIQKSLRNQYIHTIYLPFLS